MVHDLAPVVLEALQSLELLFKARRHPTGVAPWAVHMMAWHGTWNVERRALGQDHSVPSPTGRGRSEVQSNETPRAAHTRALPRSPGIWRLPTPDLYHAAVALLIERGHVSPALMRRDVRGTASQAACMRQHSPFDVHWLWRLKYTPLWESTDGRSTDTAEPQSGLLATKCIKLGRLRFEGTGAFAPPGRKTCRSLASVRTASFHETWGGEWERQQRSGSDPDTGGGGTEGQRLIVYMVEVATFRMHCDDYPPADELDLITHGNDALPEGAGGLTLRQRATIALLRNGARHHV